MNWMPIPGGGEILKHEGLIAKMELPEGYLPMDNRYNMSVYDAAEDFEVAFASNRSLDEGKDYAEEIIRDYLSE